MHTRLPLSDPFGSSSDDPFDYDLEYYLGLDDKQVFGHWFFDNYNMIMKDRAQGHSLW